MLKSPERSKAVLRQTTRFRIGSRDFNVAAFRRQLQTSTATIMSTLFVFPASFIPQAHTIFAGLAFSTALFIGWASGLWKELCENAVSGELANRSR